MQNFENDQNETCCKNIQEKLTQAEKQILYLRADFENAQRNMIRESHLRSQKNAVDIIKQFLNVFDDFRRCSDAAKHSSDTSLKEGLAVVTRSMTKTFEAIGIETIETKTFDPEKHEALSYIPSTAEHSDGEIAEVVIPGYTYQGKVLRPAQVIVASEIQ